MSEDHVARVGAAVEAIRVQGLRSFSWFHRKEPVLDRGLARRLPLEMQREHFREVLASKLYASFYCLGFATPSHHEPIHPVLLASKRAFVSELSAGNLGAGYEDEGWAVHAVCGDDVVVQKNGVTLRVERTDCLVPSAHGLPRPGMRLGIRMPKNLCSLCPGYYVALGDRPLVANEPLVRLYWNLRNDGAVAFMRAATAALNEARLAFRLKSVDHPARFLRRDAVVLYATKASYSRVRDVLERVYPMVAASLRSGTPAFTKRIAPGLGLAEDPPSGTSFGLHRCRILAEAVLQAHELRQRRPEERLETVVRRFEANQISLQRPYLNPGSSDEYVFTTVRRVSPPSPSSRAATVAADGARGFRASALEIGRLLTQRAIWSGNRCNWMGLDAYGALGSFESSQPVAYKALGPTLFTGTSGIALFLAELSAAGGADPEVRRTAVAAVDQALSLAPALRAAGRLGLYDGVVGIGVAAATIDRLLGEQGLSEGSRALMHDVLPEELDSVDSDLLSGLAGIVAGLLTLHALWRDANLLDAATRCGEALLQRAMTQENRSCWSSAGFPSQRPLTGFSHGAAGIGYALLELFHVTGEARYREAGESAFRYERHWFDETAANWPDFRGVPARAGARTHSFSFPVAWCHGSAGIALSRLRAYQILGKHRYKAEAQIALKTTMTWTAETLRSEIGNFALCHGLAGNAAVLNHGTRVLGAEFGDGKDVAEEAARACVQSQGEPSRRWAFGVLGDRSPSLMLGLAGLGHFCLGLADPAIPSPLILEPERIARRLDARAQAGAPAA